MNPEVYIKIHVENFKSLRDFRMECHKFNVLIGVNGSGKTNILEMFKFAKSCINPSGSPAYPFGPWSGFRNIVWSCDTNLPIRLEMQYNVGEYDFEYKMAIDGSSGRAEFVNEELRISNYMHILRSFKDIRYQIDADLLEYVKSELGNSKVKKHFIADIPQEPWEEKISNSRSILPNILNRPMPIGMSIINKMKSVKQISSSDDNTHHHHHHPTSKIDLAVTYSIPHESPSMIPVIKIHDEDNGREDYIHDYVTQLFIGQHPVVLLRQLNYANLRKSPPVDYPSGLEDDGTGLINLLFRWHNSSKGLPRRIEQAIEELFPNWQISFTVTDDGRIVLNVNDGNTVLSPPSIPDGFYKLLAILTAIELEPKFLLIDEVETSLHADIIEYILDELSTCNSCVIVTTHSPLVIDSVEPEDVVILERTESGTVGKRINNTKQMKEELLEKGLTLSESWIYGSP